MVYHGNRKYRHLITGIAAILLTTAYSCSPAKYVPEDEYLLQKNKIELSEKSVPRNDINRYILQRPNKKLLGIRFYLFLYNMSNINKQGWPHKWLRDIGEEPVIYNREQIDGSVERISQFLENKGYYHAEVSDSVRSAGRNVKVSYLIEPNKPNIIRSLNYIIEDTAVYKIILADTINSLLYKGMVFDKDLLQDERERIEILLREQGYYRFTKDYVLYTAAIEEGVDSTDLTLSVRNYGEIDGQPVFHPKYIIGDVYIYPDATISASESLQPKVLHDTTEYNSQYFISRGRSRLNPAAITNASYLVPGEYYKLSNVDRTYRNLSELGIIRYTNINFLEQDTTISAGSSTKLIDCHIELTQKDPQAYQIELAGTNSGGDLGIRGNLLYQNFNLFRGAEIFNIRFTGAIEALSSSSTGLKSMEEIGVESGIVIPKFLSPFRLEGFVKKYSPRTSISASYNYQARPDYTRSIANSSFSYNWRSASNITHTLWPFEINYVQIYENRSTPEFIDSIQNTLIGYSFKDHLVNSARYSFELNNQAIGQSRDFIYLRYNLESAGNIVNTVSSAIKGNQENAPRLIFDVPYFQYLRSDIDMRYYNVFTARNMLVYRLFMGAGYAYGNSGTLPYEKKYFSGGPNSIRAWSSRDLGPGSFSEPDSLRLFAFPNSTGDIKLELNLEYRFKVVWKMEGALFADMGNIWDIGSEEGKPGADFRWNRFLSEMAVGTGFGIRFDFSFFLLRFDFGLKLHDPALPEESRWLPVFSDFSLDDLSLKFGIGYPF